MATEGGGDVGSNFVAPGKPKASRISFHFVRMGKRSFPGENFILPIHKWQFHSLLIYLLSMANPIFENRIVERSWTDARH